MFDLIIKNGNLLTIESNHIENKSILIKNGLIAEIVENEQTKEIKSKKVLDANGLIIMPGLIDCHSHMIEYATQYTHHIQGKSQNMGIVANLLEDLKSGITTVGDHCLGHPILSTSIDIVKNVSHNTIVNIKIATGICAIGTEPIVFTSSITPGTNILFECLDDTYISRIAVENEFPGENIFITATPANLPYALVPNAGKIVFRKDKIQQIVEIFHNFNRKIGAHIEGSQNIQLFIDCNGDVVHHGHGANIKQFKEMAAKNIFFVATPHGGTNATPNTPKQIYYALKAGVVIAIATDSYLPVHPKSIDLNNLTVVGPQEFLKICQPTFIYLTRNGVSKIDCLKMITLNAAKVLGLEMEIGSIKKNKKADLILCKGMPVFDFVDIDSILMVIKDGIIEIDRTI